MLPWGLIRRSLRFSRKRDEEQVRSATRLQGCRGLVFVVATVSTEAAAEATKGWRGKEEEGRFEGLEWKFARLSQLPPVRERERGTPMSTRRGPPESSFASVVVSAPSGLCSPSLCSVTWPFMVRGSPTPTSVKRKRAALDGGGQNSLGVPWQERGDASGGADLDRDMNAPWSFSPPPSKRLAAE